MISAWLGPRRCHGLSINSLHGSGIGIVVTSTGVGVVAFRGGTIVTSYGIIIVPSDEGIVGDG